MPPEGGGGGSSAAEARCGAGTLEAAVSSAFAPASISPLGRLSDTSTRSVSAVPERSFRESYFGKSAVQKPHLMAASGISDLQNGHSFLLGGGGVGVWWSRLTCFTNMKTAKA